MSTPEKRACERCGAVVPARSTETLCPACLMSGALAAPGDETLSAAPGQSPTPLAPTEFPHDFGEYRLLGLLGSGGMGTVYEAEHLTTGRRVALKTLGQQLDSPEMRQRFLREGRLAASVNHPNSLYVFGSEEIESAPVITMEIAGGGTLKDRLDQRGRFSVKTAVDAILDVISGLEAAHAAGVLHRDVKPSNCFVAPDGSVKVGDFGLSVSTLAKDDSYVTATGVIMGTPAYAPPEQLRGDDLDVRADIYSVGATLFTLLTDRAPFEGKNAVQVVANVINRKPKPLRELCDDAPPGLERVVARCLSKAPEGRYDNYMALRNALLPFSSRAPEPASLTIRAQAGWIDYLIAFLVPYVPLMLAVGNDQFHLGFLMERTLFSARYYLAFLSFGILYFTLSEGIRGAGVGKRLKGLRVVRKRDRPAGIGRAFLRILIQVISIEGVRVPLLLATISATRIDDMTAAEVVTYSVATALCPLIPVVMSLTARRENGFATVWDLASGTRVVIEPKGVLRVSVEPAARPEKAVAGAGSLGPYEVLEQLASGSWIVASDPILRRRVWLLRRGASAPSDTRRNLSRPGRLRWLQSVETAEGTWDAYEAVQGVPFASLADGEQRVPWGTLRHWLHDLASELWSAAGDQTLPDRLGLDHVWITESGQAILLDEPWPDVAVPAGPIPVGDVAGQQRFLSAVAGRVDSTSLPLHARPALTNLEAGRFEKLSFLTGTLRGLLERPADVSRGIRAGSIFMLPLYVGIMLFVGARGAEWLHESVGSSTARIALATVVVVLTGSALVQLLLLPFRTTEGQAIFRLAVIDGGGTLAGRTRLLARWTIVWLPLLLPLLLLFQFAGTTGGIPFAVALVWIVLWILATVYAVSHPNRGLHDRLADTWVVRR